MSSYIFSHIKQKIVQGNINFHNGGIYKIALMGNIDINNINTHCGKTVWSEIKSMECQEGNYNSLLLNNVGIGVKQNNPCANYFVYSDDIIYNVATIQAYSIVIVKDTTNVNDIGDNSELICNIDITHNGQPKVSNNGVFRIILNQNNGGFLEIE